VYTHTHTHTRINVDTPSTWKNKVE